MRRWPSEPELLLSPSLLLPWWLSIRFSINDMEDDDVMMRPDRALVYISSSPWTEQGWRL